MSHHLASWETLIYNTGHYSPHIFGTEGLCSHREMQWTSFADADMSTPHDKRRADNSCQLYHQLHSLRCVPMDLLCRMMYLKSHYGPVSNFAGFHQTSAKLTSKQVNVLCPYDEWECCRTWPVSPTTLPILARLFSQPSLFQVTVRCCPESTGSSGMCSKSMQQT